ncbi:MAG: hypothetical protein PHC28_02360, partial [Flavobacterium sp.]|uniref:hypothetical protein n=1 Tax=Flavobacterium sp. TaxID=239 RepID=UPI00260E8AFB
GADFYKDLFCENPTIKSEQTNMIQFLDRENETIGRISLDKTNGKYLISDISFRFYPTQEKIEKCKLAGEKNCRKVSNTSEIKKNETSEIQNNTNEIKEENNNQPKEHSNSKALNKIKEAKKGIKTPKIKLNF